MSEYLSYRDGGKTSEQGLFQWLAKFFTKGVPTVNSTTSFQVVQRGAGANMSVDITQGDGNIADTNYNYWGFSDATNNQTITAADPTNPRRDIVVAYVDKSVVSSASNNNPGALKFKVVAGTPAGSPVDPTDPTIQSSVGASNPYIKLSRVAVAANAASIVNANLTDLRPPIAVMARLWGGASNTSGHIVPNVADDTVTLNAATQTLTNKTLTSPTVTSPAIGGTPTLTGWDGWEALSNTPNTITANGNRSYSLVFNGVDLTGTQAPGFRLRTTRTVAAPTQCTSLNGTTQYYSKTTPAGMTFTNNFVVSAWVKMTSYGAASSVLSRYNGTSGFNFGATATGQIVLEAFNGGAGNSSYVLSYQSIPLNKWVHIAAQLDMATFTATTTTSYVMIDGVDVPASVTRTGTNPTALIQAGNLEIGSRNGGLQPFPGKIAQAAIYSAKVTEANVVATISQGLAGTETSLISAYPFNNSINDLNANANNLTANGSAVATNADSPFGGQAGGSISSTLDYGIVTSATFSTNTTLTVQVPEGCTIPTSGGVSAVSYSTVAAPYGFPKQRGKWEIKWLAIGSLTLIGTNNTWGTGGTTTSTAFTIPIGEWRVTYDFNHYTDRGGSVNIEMYQSLSTNSSAETDVTWTGSAKFGTGSGLTYAGTRSTRTGNLSLSAQTVYYGLFKGNSSDGTIGNPGLNIIGTGASSVVAECAYL